MKQNRIPNSLAFKLDDASLEKVKQAASAHGETPGTYARRIVCDAAGATIEAPKPRRVIANGDAMRGLTGELGRHGSLLNQLARSSNMQADPKAAEALREMQAAYEATLYAVRLAVAGASAP
jgi:hypothetical protein